MGLTSGSLLLLLVVAAIGWIIATVLVWPRLAPGGGSRARKPGAGRLAVRTAGRAGLLLTSQALVLAAFLVWLNSYFAFYGSWSELLGNAVTTKTVKPADPSPKLVRTAPAAGRPTRGLPAAVKFYGFGLGPGHDHPGPPPHAYLPGVRRLARLPGAARYGMLARVQIKGLRTGLVANSGYVYLPPEYFQRAYARDKFPAVLALTGYPGGAKSIIDRLGLASTSARLVSEHHARPVVYVMLNVSPVLPRDTECTNIPAGPQVATFFAVDVPQAIERTFRVSASRSDWGALGYSTGGYCATKLAMLYPGTFSTAVSIAGYYVALKDDTTGNLYGSSQAYRNENDLDWRLRHLPVPPVSVLVTSSKVGESTYQGTLRFLRLIRPPMHAYSYIIPVGGHNFGVWSQELPPTLEWLTTRLGHPAAGSPSEATRQPGAAALPALSPAPMAGPKPHSANKPAA
jgi:enterochelin esterase-like enzyme